MNRNIAFKLMVLIISIILLTGIFAYEQEPGPRYVIVMIGDGMGFNHVQMAHEYIGEKLNMEKMPFKGTSKTTSLAGIITDSAAGGSALACGVKVLNGHIGIDSITHEPIENIREFFAGKGKKTGLVVTDIMTGATPASFGSHTRSRYNTDDIARQFIDNEIDIIMCGGSYYFSEGLLDEAKNNKGYTYIASKTQLEEFDGSSKLLGLFTNGTFPYYINGYNSETPTLAEMTAKSIEILSKSEHGFFLMVEGSRIDHAAHNQLIDEHIGEMLEFDKVVKLAMDFAKQDGNTLVIVTADHETGGLKKIDGTYVFRTYEHTGASVPVYAIGKGAFVFQGDMDNTDITNRIKKLYEPVVVEATVSITPGPTATATTVATLEPTEEVYTLMPPETMPPAPTDTIIPTISGTPYFYLEITNTPRIIEEAKASNEYIYVLIFIGILSIVALIVIKKLR